MKKKKVNNLPNKRTPEVMEEHKAIIAEYYANGFSGQNAVAKFRPHLDISVCATVWQAIKNNPKNKEYMSEWQGRLSSMVDLKTEHVTRELISWAYNDATQYMGLDVEAMKNLPPEARRAIQSYEINDTFDKHGNFTGQTVKVKLVPKLDSIKELAKHIGYYQQDNEQKANKVNILNILKESNPDTLNALLATIEANQIENE